MNLKTILAIGIVIIIILGSYIINRKSKINNTSNPQSNQQTITNQQSNTNTPPSTQDQEDASPKIVSPINNAGSRITKKLYGTHVTPKDSPVMPEKFTGFHTGVDFETMSGEENSDIAISAICDGKLLNKARASGYGGYAVQACTINGQAVTVVYGHLRQSSISPSIGAELKAGEQFAVLGTGFTAETDGERKHLHLSIHIGNTVNIKGYVPTQGELSAWLDPQTVLELK